MRQSVPTPPVAPLVIRPCVVVSVHDGDTLRVSPPLQFLWPDMRSVVVDVRVAHVNASELATANGKTALAAVKALLADPNNAPVTLHVYGREKYGRLIADVQLPGGMMLSAYVLTLPGTAPMDFHAQLAGLP